MDDSWNVTEDGQQDVDQQVGTATTLEEDTEWWEDDRQDDLEDIRAGERHCEGVAM